MVNEMENEVLPETERQLNRFCRQYLQLHLQLDYPDGELLRSDLFQQNLYKNLFAENALSHAPPVRYQLRALKELTRRIEQSIQDWEEEGISDDLMNCLSSLIVSPIPSEITAAQQKSYVTYTLSSLTTNNGPIPAITLLESHNLLAAAGTTGLRTWEAALHLGNYLCAHPHLIVQKSILELGAGTGYISILCARHLSASHVLSTDGSSDVVAALPTNFYLNSLQDSEKIEAKELLWGHALVGSEHPEWNKGRKIDVVIGADVTYDGTGIPALVATFDDLFRLNEGLKILISAAVRNDATFNKFITACEQWKLEVEEVEWPTIKESEQEGPFYQLKAPTKILMITKSQ